MQDVAKRRNTMPTECPTCGGKKDRRAKNCKNCVVRTSDPDKWYTAKNGYKSKRIKGKLIYQHRFVMQEYLGRKLAREEVVHHINHDPGDNRIENLELLASHSDHMQGHCDSEIMKLRSIKGHKARWGFVTKEVCHSVI